MGDEASIDIAIIGSGNLANFLAKNLVDKKLNLTQIHSRNSESGIALSTKMNCLFVSDIKSINAGVIFVAVTDNQVVKIVSNLPHNSIVLSTSGVINLSKSTHPTSDLEQAQSKKPPQAMHKKATRVRTRTGDRNS